MSPSTSCRRLCTPTGETHAAAARSTCRCWLRPTAGGARSVNGCRHWRQTPLSQSTCRSVSPSGSTQVGVLLVDARPAHLVGKERGGEPVRFAQPAHGRDHGRVHQLRVRRLELHTASDAREQVVGHELAKAPRSSSPTWLGGSPNCRASACTRPPSSAPGGSSPASQRRTVRSSVRSCSSRPARASTTSRGRRGAYTSRLRTPRGPASSKRVPIGLGAGRRQRMSADASGHIVTCIRQRMRALEPVGLDEAVDRLPHDAHAARRRLHRGAEPLGGPQRRLVDRRRLDGRRVAVDGQVGAGDVAEQQHVRQTRVATAGATATASSVVPDPREV